MSTPLAIRLSQARAYSKIADLRALEEEARRHHKRGRLEQHDLDGILHALACLKGARRAKDSAGSSATSPNPYVDSAADTAQLSLSAARIKSLVDWQMQQSGKGTAKTADLVRWQLAQAGRAS
jgi:hypothetical protein